MESEGVDGGTIQKGLKKAGLRAGTRKFVCLWVFIDLFMLNCSEALL